MKQYTYRGSQRSLSIGGLAFLSGIALAVSMAMHDKISKHPVIKSLVNSGEMEISDAEAEQTDVKPAETQDYGKLTVPQLKGIFIQRNIFFDDATAKKADLIALLEQDDQAKQAANQDGSQGT